MHPNIAILLSRYDGCRRLREHRRTLASKPLAVVYRYHVGCIVPLGQCFIHHFLRTVSILRVFTLQESYSTKTGVLLYAVCTMHAIIQSSRAPVFLLLVCPCSVHASHYVVLPSTISLEEMWVAMGRLLNFSRLSYTSNAAFVCGKNNGPLLE